MSIEILDCLKHERDICVKTIITSQNTAFMWTSVLRVILEGHTGTMVTHCVTKMITTCSPIIGQCFFLASFPAYHEDDDAWLGSISAAFWSPVYVPPREEGRNAGSFLDQRLVIEPNGRLTLGMQSVECSFLR